VPKPNRFAQSLRPWLRIFAWTLAATALLEAGWLAAFAWSLRSGWLLGLANRRPDKIRVELASARSYWPGMIDVEGLRITGRTPRVDWDVRVDRFRGEIALPDLVARRFEVAAAEARGVELVSTPRLSAPPLSGPANLPPPAVVVAHATAPATAPPRAGHWSFVFHNLQVDEIRSVKLDETEFRGNARGRGGFEIDGRSRRARVETSRVELAELGVWRRGEPLGRHIGGEIDLRMLSWPYAEKRGRDLLPYASGRLRLDGELDDRPLLDELLRRAPWIRVQPALSTISADLRFDRGILLGPGRLVARRPASQAQLLDFDVTGSNELDVAVVSRLGGRATADWQLRFADFSVRSGEAAAPLLTGSDLVLAGHSDDPEMGDLASGTEIQLDLGRARLPDLTRLAFWLPASTRLELLEGSASVSGTTRLRLADRALHGEIRVLVERARLRWAGVELDGRIDATLALAGADLERRSFDVSGSHLLLADFRSPDIAATSGPPAKGWWADLHLQDARFDLSPRLALASRFHARLRDTSPIVGLFELKRNLPQWASRALTVENIEVRGRFGAAPGRLDLAELESPIYGGKLSARALFEESHRRGRLLLAWKHLAVAAGFDGSEHTVKIAGARDWFSGFTP
jgi:hypothetical protein